MKKVESFGGDIQRGQTEIKLPKEALKANDDSFSSSEEDDILSLSGSGGEGKCALGGLIVANKIANANQKRQSVMVRSTNPDRPAKQTPRMSMISVNRQSTERSVSGTPNTFNNIGTILHKSTMKQSHLSQIATIAERAKQTNQKIQSPSPANRSKKDG
jgi:hypothetical protein